MMTGVVMHDVGDESWLPLRGEQLPLADLSQLNEHPDGMVRIHVSGVSRPQGSKRGMIGKHTGKVVMVEQVKGLAHWRQRVASEAQVVMAGRPPLEGPLGMNLLVRITRPKSHPKRRRTWPIGMNTGDRSKHLRSAEDAITGIVARDDAQFVDGWVRKVYVTDEPPGVDIAVWEVTE